MSQALSDQRPQARLKHTNPYLTPFYAMVVCFNAKMIPMI